MVTPRPVNSLEAFSRTGVGRMRLGMREGLFHYESGVRVISGGWQPASGQRLPPTRYRLAAGAWRLPVRSAGTPPSICTQVT